MDATNKAEQFAELEKTVTEAINSHNYDAALTHANTAADTFLSPGYMLLAQTHYAMSAQQDIDKTNAKSHIEQAIAAIAQAVKHLESSNTLMEQVGYVLTTDTLEQFGIACKKHANRLGIQLD